MSNFNESFNKKIRIELSEQKGGVALSPAQIKNAVEAAAKAQGTCKGYKKNRGNI